MQTFKVGHHILKYYILKCYLWGGTIMQFHSKLFVLIKGYLGSSKQMFSELVPVCI